MNSHTVITADDAQRLAQTITGLPLPFTLTWREGKPRGTDHNSKVHVWFSLVAKHEGSSLKDVKGFCSREWGVPICSRDPQWLWVWTQVSEHLNYEQECSVLGSEIIACTSRMTSGELKEYMDEMQRFYAEKGIVLE